MKTKQEIKQRKKTIIRREFYIDCPYCKKEIKGGSESQVLWNLGLHKKQKHRGRK